jgi:simple sugar transport system ATP-binding protein
MYSGRILAIVSPDTPREEIGLLMAGITGAAVDAQTEVIELPEPRTAPAAAATDETGTTGDATKGTT